MIHKTAIIHPKAKLDATAEVGPYAVIDEGVELGAHCIVGPHVYLTGITKIGSHNRFHAGCVIGDAPQDLKYNGEPTRLRIGSHNVFRENATVHRSTTLDGETIVGSHNFFMAGSHVGHNTHVGNHVILANGALLGGHAAVHDRAFISGNCCVHQFCRVGTMSMMQGGSAISKDLPPFTNAANGVNKLCGLNVVGLRRANFTPAQRLELKKIYHLIFRRKKNLAAAIEEVQKKFSSPAAKIVVDFVINSKRGVCTGTTRSISQTEDE
ncbi:MAG TPA: acyl-ACP--UDP-N-acetylglucosamine O-acyltransferase [Verrucomicrobiae bacterium]|jgi:UDP-N-acetylglucosamine acyltransferase|nr:acyl-ACP--UDP-N-acetylglucosamine O-acyltransferase [Verrucomicrobiae bacterium]